MCGALKVEESYLGQILLTSFHTSCTNLTWADFVTQRWGQRWSPFRPSREVQKYSNITHEYNGREPTPTSIEFPNTVSCCYCTHTLFTQQLLDNNLQNSFITVTSNKNWQSTILFMLSFLKTDKSIGNVSSVSSWLSMKWLSNLLLISLLTFRYNAPFTIVLTSAEYSKAPPTLNWDKCY